MSRTDHPLSDERVHPPGATRGATIAIRSPAQPAQAGSRTSRRSPSSVRLPPIASMTRRAVDAPRSFRSSASTIGAAASGIGEISTVLRCERSRPARVRRGARRRVRARARPASTGSAIDANRRAGAARHRLLPEPLRCRPRELERVDFEQRRLVAARLDPRRDPELVEELGHLLGGRPRSSRRSGRPAPRARPPRERVREAVHGRERRAQVVARERDEARKILGGARKAQYRPVHGRAAADCSTDDLQASPPEVPLGLSRAGVTRRPEGDPDQLRRPREADRGRRSTAPSISTRRRRACTCRASPSCSRRRSRRS